MKCMVSVGEPEKPESTVVLVDTYRSSTTITKALQNGAKFVVPFRDSKTALNKKERWEKEGEVVLAGEEYGEKIDGFDHDTHPWKMTEENVGGKIVLFRSSNLTRILDACRGVERILIGGLINSKGVAKYLKKIGPEKIEIIACGIEIREAIMINDELGVACDKKSQISIEDLLGAGAILHNLKCKTLSDFALVSLLAYENPEWKDKIEKGRQARLARKFGNEKDMNCCFEENTSNIVPVMKGERIIPYRP